MSKRNIIIIVIAGVVVLGIAVYFIARAYQSSYQPYAYPANPQAQPTNQLPSNSGQTAPVDNSGALKGPASTTPAPTPNPTPTPAPKPNPAPVPSSAKTYTVNIANFAFSPSSISINAGDTIVWKNNDSVPHQIVGAGFGSNPLSNGQSYSFKFNSAGTYNYHCAIHPSMTGSITVK